MAFDLTEDQLALRDGIRALVEGRFPIARVRDRLVQKLSDSGKSLEIGCDERLGLVDIDFELLR